MTEEARTEVLLAPNVASFRDAMPRPFFVDRFGTAGVRQRDGKEFGSTG